MFIGQSAQSRQTDIEEPPVSQTKQLTLWNVQSTSNCIRVPCWSAGFTTTQLKCKHGYAACSINN
jgi:hypothetical protein